MAPLLNTRRPWVRLVVPTCIILGMGYGTYAFGYALGYKEIYQFHSKGAAIGLWILLAVFQLLLYFYWVLILVKGPGFSEKITYETIPDYFICDEYGHPYWCSNCQSIKLSRVKHMSTYDKCVHRADHFCIWVGGVIGQNNYRPFLKFMLYFLSYFVIGLIFLATYTRDNIERGLNNNFIVMYILLGYWIIIVFALLASHIHYITKNLTTLDDMSRKSARRYALKHKDEPKTKPGHGVMFVNVKKDEFRLVVQCSVFDNMFNFGFKNNFVNIMLHNTDQHFPHQAYSTPDFFKALAVFVIPFADIWYTGVSTDEINFSPAFKAYLHLKIDEKRCYLAQNI